MQAPATATRLDRDLGFLRGRQGYWPHDDDDDEEVDNEVEDDDNDKDDNNDKCISSGTR